MKRVLLHICCVIDLVPAVQRLREEGYSVIGYFHNPNIQPEEEYRKRLQEVWRLSVMWDVPTILPAYNPIDFFRETVPFWNTPERGERCRVCISKNLKATRDLALSLGIEYFATTLTASRFKDLNMVNFIGNSLSTNETVYLESAFRKSGGQEIAVKIAKMYKLYRQNYCGCVYSKRDAIMKRRQNNT